MLEIRILSGARAGQVDRFDKPVVVVGRHAVVDLRFSPEKDLDVSGRHAEIRVSDGGRRYSVHDMGSTNGTFVNGERITGSVDVKDGDHVRFGTSGPEVEIRTAVQSVSDMMRKRTTEERIAVAVKQQTRGLKTYLTAVVVLLLAGSSALYYWTRESKLRAEQLQRRLAISDSLVAILQGGSRGDTALLSRLVRVDLPAIHRRNAPAVALLVAEINGKSYAGSGFAITSDGVIVTNRHNVRDVAAGPTGGASATRIAVKFADTREWLPAHIVSVSDSSNADLALIQMDRAATYPAVEGVSCGATDVTEGNSVVTIGFPLGYDTPMEGAGNDFMAKATLNPGTVSKRTSGVLQIDSYAAHGSSGSPVFNTRGVVVGVVYGGASEGGGRIVYAVPPDLLCRFVPAAVVRD